MIVRRARPGWTRLVGTLAVVACAGDIAAQAAGTLTGTVTIQGIGQGFPGAHVTIDGLGLTTVTDIDGRFEFLSVPPGTYQVRAEVIGCRPGGWPVEVFADAVSTLDVAAGGSAFRTGGASGAGSGTSLRTDVPFTVERLGPEDLRDDPARSIGDLLRGAFPGVKVVQGSGLPGEGLSIQFRGPGSISGSEDPLVVVDGIITGGGLDDIDPRDIESIEILKGASGAAIYGARGGAGVIEITTARGPTGSAAACILRGRASS